MFAVGFLMRPVGGWLMGLYADRHGRKAALMASVLLMCAGSLLIALTPGYDRIGIAAPALLLFARLLQGLSVGGEYGTSATYLSEMADARRRGFWSSFQYVTLVMGQLIALALLIVLQRLLLSEQQLHDWGWRIPFAIGAVLALSALYLRRDMQETESFAAAKSLDRQRGSLRVLLQYPREVLTVVGLTMGGTLAFYTFTTYPQKFLVNTGGFSKADATLVSAASLFVFMLLQPLGRRVVGPHRTTPGADRLRRARNAVHLRDPQRNRRRGDDVGGVRLDHGRAGDRQRLYRDQRGGEGGTVPRAHPRARRRPALRPDRVDLRRHRGIRGVVVQEDRTRAVVLLVRDRLHRDFTGGVHLHARYPAAFAHRPRPRGAMNTAAAPGNTLPHVVVIGGGFAGLWATRALANAPVRITLVDRGNHHLFQPLLYQVATAGLSAPDIAAPLRHILRRQRNVTVLMESVAAIDTQARATCDSITASALDYDFLLLASGATHAYFGHDEWARHAPGLKTLDDALHIRRRMLSAFERAEAEDDPVAKRALLTFVIVGGGPTGVELAGTLAEIARHTLKREFRRIDPREARVLLLEAGPRVLSTFPESLSARSRQQLEKLGVEVRTGTPVNAIDADGVLLGETRIPARTVLWAAGVAASPLAKTLGVPLDRAGRVLVQAGPHAFPARRKCSSPAISHRVQQDGKPVPGVAPAAKQMGATSPPRSARAWTRDRSRRSAIATTATSPPSAAWPRWCISAD